MNREEFVNYIHQSDIIRQDYVVRIRKKHQESDIWTYCNELLIVSDDDPFQFEWENDWWEGEEFVEIIGYAAINSLEIQPNIYQEHEIVSEAIEQEATINPNPDFNVEDEFIEKLKLVKDAMSLNQIAILVESFVQEHGPFSFKNGEIVRQILNEVQQDAE